MLSSRRAVTCRFCHSCDCLVPVNNLRNTTKGDLPKQAAPLVWQTLVALGDDRGVTRTYLNADG